MTSNECRRKAEYIRRVTRGEGFMPWQEHESIAPAEGEFRAAIEERKTNILTRRIPVRHPVLLTACDFDRARRQIARAQWARTWFANIRDIADHVAGQPADYVERMIPALTPMNPYGFTCPRCVGRLSQEGSVYYGGIPWDYHNPEVFHCRHCGQAYPDPAFPETGRVVCPRSGQTLTFYVNDAERRHPRDRSGRYAWKWVGKPVHVSFSGMIRESKVLFIIRAAHALALSYRLSGDPRYAEPVVAILRRLGQCYRNWLYHDFYDTFADCDPLYAAWHDMELPLEWKRHACGMAYGGTTYETGPVDDQLDQAKMLATYFGCGRYHSSTDLIGMLVPLSVAYDLTWDAMGRNGRPLWTQATRTEVERDLFLEYVLTAEPWLGGPGKATNVNNKAPRVYGAVAALARALGLPHYADLVLKGYEAICKHAFRGDGLSLEGPFYTIAGFLSPLIWVPEYLHGFTWPQGHRGRRGTVNVYGTDRKLRRMMQSVIEVLRPDGRYLPLSDTREPCGPGYHLLEISARRYPDLHPGALKALAHGESPTEYSLFHHAAGRRTTRSTVALPEVLFPDWQTAILRHGSGPRAAVLALPFNPAWVHSQRDSLALYYTDGGQTILGDHGYVCDTPMSHWISSTFSHNLVVVDDAEQLLRKDWGDPQDRAPSLRQMVTSPRISLVEAESHAYAQCRAYRRLVALVKGPRGATFALDIFRVQGGRKHAYRLFSELASSDAKGGSRRFKGLSMPKEPPLPDFGASIAMEHITGLRDVCTAHRPAPPWQALWQQRDRSYRLWMLSPCDRVEASNGPGQEDESQPGRRVRYLEVINRGENTASTFVALHEPGGPQGRMPIRRAMRLPVPAAAGPDAIAIRIETAWGDYHVFSEFAQEAEIDGIRFQGVFGVFCEPSDGRPWLLASAATTFKAGTFGFTDAPARWSGRIVEQSSTQLVTATPRPPRWPDTPRGVATYVLTGKTGMYTGYPIIHSTNRRITVADFPLAPATRFILSAVQFLTAPSDCRHRDFRHSAGRDGRRR